MKTSKTLLHTTITGHEVRYQPSPEVGAFLDRLAAMLDDPTVTENDMIVVGFSRENPMLVASLGDLAGDRGWVSKEVFDDPCYRVMSDLLNRKRFAQKGTDVDAVAALYTVTVAEAAAQLGMSESAVRNAIATRRLPSWVKNGQYFMHSKGVEAFSRSDRGPKPRGADPRAAAPAESTAIRLHIGHKAGASLKLKAPHPLGDAVKVGRNETAGTLTDWSRVAVLSTKGEFARLYVLEPALGANEAIEFDGFFARGPFRVVETVTRSGDARDGFTAFVPA